MNRYLIDFGASRTRIATNGKFERTVPSVLLVSSQDGRVLVVGAAYAQVGVLNGGRLTARRIRRGIWYNDRKWNWQR